MAEIAERISQAIHKPVPYVNVAPQEKRLALLAAGIPRERVDALGVCALQRGCFSRGILGVFNTTPSTLQQ
jgi:hypothetical protein